MKNSEHCQAYENGYCNGITLNNSDRKIKCEEVPYNFLCKCYEEDINNNTKPLEIIYDKIVELAKQWDDESKYCNILQTKEGQIKGIIYKTCSEYLLNYIKDIYKELNYDF